MSKSQPSNLELQVLALLWRDGPLPAREVLNRLPDQKHRAYTTVLSVIQVMEKKGLVRIQETIGNRHVYAPAVKQKTVLGQYLRSLVNQLFGGRPSNAMQQLLETTDVGEAELAEMQNLLDEYRKGKRSGS